MAPPVLRCPPALLAANLTGRTYVVTGANSGIGLATSRQLVKQGARVVIACRRPAEAAKAKESLEADALAAGRGGSVEVAELDLLDLASVRACAAALLAAHPRLAGVALNAGIMNPPFRLSKQGHESQFAANYLGHFLLGELLLPALRAGGAALQAAAGAAGAAGGGAPPGVARDARVVVLASSYHYLAGWPMGPSVPGKIHWDDVSCTKGRKYDGWEAYAQSKLANVLHARELGARLRREGAPVTAVSAHPGYVNTNLKNSFLPAFIAACFAPFENAFLGQISVEDGMQASLYTLLADDVSAHAGEFYSQSGGYLGNPVANKGGWPIASPNENVTDENAERLARLGRELAGLPAA